jgi:hypothetical protein
VERIHKEALEKVREKPRVGFTVQRGSSTRQIVMDFSRDYSKE